MLKLATSSILIDKLNRRSFLNPETDIENFLHEKQKESNVMRPKKTQLGALIWN